MRLRRGPRALAQGRAARAHSPPCCALTLACCLERPATTEDAAGSGAAAASGAAPGPARTGGAATAAARFLGAERTFGVNSTELRAPVGCRFLRGDLTFKHVRKCTVGGLRPFEAEYAVVNEFGQILGSYACRKKALEQVCLGRSRLVPQRRSRPQPPPSELPSACRQQCAQTARSVLHHMRASGAHGRAAHAATLRAPLQLLISACR